MVPPYRQRKQQWLFDLLKPCCLLISDYASVIITIRHFILPTCRNSDSLTGCYFQSSVSVFNVSKVASLSQFGNISVSVSPAAPSPITGFWTYGHNGVCTTIHFNSSALITPCTKMPLVRNSHWCSFSVCEESHFHHRQYPRNALRTFADTSVGWTSFTGVDYLLDRRSGTVTE